MRTPLEPDDPRHGTANGYTNHGCRCDACRVAHTDYLRERQIGSYIPSTCPGCGGPKSHTSVICLSCWLGKVEAPHGSEARYKRCGCDDCREGANAARRARRLRQATR